MIAVARNPVFYEMNLKSQIQNSSILSYIENSLYGIRSTQS